MMIMTSNGIAVLDGAEIGVIVGGLAAITLVLWYFFGPRHRLTAEVTSAGVQAVRITVKGGYAPDVIVVKQGQPVRLDFYRDETASCSERVILGDLGVARDLPAFKTTTIEFTPEKAGEIIYTCGMNMIRGRIIVEPT
jgi:plastocyanin domain-containing protein